MTSHEMSGHPLYPVWFAIKKRCEDRTATGWADYGGRGILMHPEWSASPRAFIEWVEANIGPRPAGVTAGGGRGLYTINRIDNDGNYEPGNLEWADWSTQIRTQRRRVVGTFIKWLRDQEGRENDPVGWFAQFWRDLDGKPRLSAPASITKHLEDRNLFQLTPGLTEAHDATLAEYRRQREGVVRAVASEAGVAVPPPDQPPERGLAGQAVDRATEAAVAAAKAHQLTGSASADIDRLGGGTGDLSQLDRIEHKLDLICRVLGVKGGLGPDQSVIIPAPAETWGNPQGLPGWSWGDLYDQAAVYATAHGAGWDEQEQA